MSDDTGVLITKHASARFRERFPEAYRHKDPAPAIFALVQQAIKAGRIAKRAPRWIEFVAKKSERGKKYAWTADEQIVFVLVTPRVMSSKDPERAKAYRQRYLVTTVMLRDDTSDARHLARVHHADRMARQKNGDWPRRPTGARRKRRGR